MPLNQSKYQPLTPILRDMELMLLRKLTLHHKHQTQATNGTIDETVLAVGEDVSNWHKLAKKRKPQNYVQQIKEILVTYLTRQMQAQIAEGLELDQEVHLQKVLASLVNDQALDHKNLATKLSSYPLKIRSFPAYLPDLDTLNAYTLASVASQHNKLQSRELIESINQKFLSELVTITNERAELPHQHLMEISFPKQCEDNDVFLRNWENVEIEGTLNAWQVSSLAIPVQPDRTSTYDQIATNWLNLSHPKLSTISSLQLKVDHQSNTQKAMSTVIAVGTEQIESLIELINPNFGLNMAEMTSISTYIYNLIHKYTHVVLGLLTAIVENLHQNFDHGIDQKWNQLIASIGQHINGYQVDIQQFTKMRVTSHHRHLQSKQVSISDQQPLFNTDPIVKMIESATLGNLAWQ